MSKTKRYWDRIRKSEIFETNEHHCINKSSWWRTVEENLIELKIRTHQTIHELFWNKLPHEILINLLNTVCKPLNDNLKAELLEVLNNYKWKEYKQNTYSWKKPIRWPNEWCLFIS